MLLQSETIENLNSEEQEAAVRAIISKCRVHSDVVVRNNPYFLRGSTKSSIEISKVQYSDAENVGSILSLEKSVATISELVISNVSSNENDFTPMIIVLTNSDVTLKACSFENANGPILQG